MWARWKTIEMLMQRTDRALSLPGDPRSQPTAREVDPMAGVNIDNLVPAYAARSTMTRSRRNTPAVVHPPAPPALRIRCLQWRKSGVHSASPGGKQLWVLVGRKSTGEMR